MLESDRQPTGVKRPDADESLDDEVRCNGYGGCDDRSPRESQVGPPGEIDEDNRCGQRHRDLFRRDGKRGSGCHADEIDGPALRPHGANQRRGVTRRRHQLRPPHDIRYRLDVKRVHREEQSRDQPDHGTRQIAGE